MLSQSLLVLCQCTVSSPQCGRCSCRRWLWGSTGAKTLPAYEYVPQFNSWIQNDIGLYQHRPQIACFISKSIYIYIQHTKTATWFSSSLSVFFVPKHWPPRHMFVSMVPDRKQTISHRRRKDFSAHAPTMLNRCVMRHCPRSWSKSGQICCILW